MDKETLKKLIDLDYTTKMLAEYFGLSPSTARYYLSKYGLKTNHKKIGEKKSKVWLPTDKEFSQIILESASIAEALRKLGMTRHPNNYQSIKIRCKRLGLSPRRAKNGHYSRLSILRKDSTAGRRSVKLKVLREGLLEYKCQICGMEPFWNGMELGLTLDHINGTPDDHRIENLRFVCPNCDRQLETYCNKNWKNNEG